MVYSIARWWCSLKRTRVATNRSQRLKTVVNNTSKLHLTIKSYYIHMEGTAYYGGEEFQIPAGMRTEIHSGKFIREYVTFRDNQEIHVISGDRVLHALRHDDFHVNEGKELVFDMLDYSLCYAFVDPTQGITRDQWIRGCCTLT